MFERLIGETATTANGMEVIVIVIVIVGIKIENDIKSFNFVYEISVQYIYS